MLQSCRKPSLLRSLFHRSYYAPIVPSAQEVEGEDLDTLRRRRKSEWKRQQRGQTFLDYTIVTIRAGKGGDGCAAFHREKWKPYGPPSGGNGGRGGDVFIKPTSHLTTLSSVPKKITGEAGGNGQGSWLNGKNGTQTVIQVPLGTIVRELARDDPRRTKDEWESEEEALQGLTVDLRKRKMRDYRWVHYPGAGEENSTRDCFLEAEKALFREERERRLDRYEKSLQRPIAIDLDEEMESTIQDDAPLGIRSRPNTGHIVASGGTGGLGNPHFLARDNRSPKFATRGNEGERITLSLELKILADVGLVGYPNAGKSTLLRALTGGRANTEVADYAFTTLNPSVGVVRLAADGHYEGSVRPNMIYGDTQPENQEALDKLHHGEYAFSITRNQLSHTEQDSIRAGHGFDLYETFRFTIADNPGLVERASENVGLGHSFLRSLERSHALVYVVDLSGPAPWDELAILKDELEAYKPGMSQLARMVVATKADLLGGEGDSVEVEAAKAKLLRLTEWVDKELGGDGHKLDLVPISAKFSQNLQKVVDFMREYVEEAREESA